MNQDSGAAAPAARPFGGFGVDTILAGTLLFAGAILFLSLAPSAYYAYLAIHVLSAVIWVGGDVTLTVLGIVFERRGEGETLGALGAAVAEDVDEPAGGLARDLTDERGQGDLLFPIDAALRVSLSRQIIRDRRLAVCEPALHGKPGLHLQIGNRLDGDSGVGRAAEDRGQ